MYKIGTHTFNSESEYKSALRDEKIIEEIRAKTDFTNSEEVKKLYASMQNGSLSFESVLGREFDDEIYELTMKLKEKEASSPGKRAGREGKKASSKIKKSSDRKSEFSNAYIDKKAKELIVKKDKRRKVFMILCAVVAFLCLSYYVFYYFMTLKTEKVFSDMAELKEADSSAIPEQKVVIHYTDEDGTLEEMTLTVLEEYKTLYNKNKSLIGWIKIADTNIDYPVMQCEDADYYLTHNFYQEYDKNGCIFADPECDLVRRSDNVILYGHHMKSGRMFGSLEKYESKKYYEEHKFIQFDTIYEKGIYQIAYVFRSKIYNEDDIVFKYYQFIDVGSGMEFDSNIDEMEEMSFYDTGVDVNYGDKLLTLSTCDYQEKNGRFVVVAKKID